METKTKSARRREDPGLKFQKLISSARSPEEVLFKINELLFMAEDSSTRKNVRAPVAVPVRYRVGGVAFSGITYTISREGLFIKSREPFPRDTLVELEIELPDVEETVAAEGMVVHCISLHDAKAKGGISGMALVFNRIKATDRRRLDRFVRSRAREIYKA